MSETYVITLPEVKGVTLAPNPCAVGQSYTVAVTVAEITKVLSPEIIYSGEIYSNEV